MKIVFVILGASLAINIDLFAAEAGMPQLDPKYWASQAFWLVLVFTLLYLVISKFFIPKIKSSLDDRENKIKSDIDEANNLKELSEKKQKEYNLVLENTKKEVQKILSENKNSLNIEIHDDGPGIPEKFYDLALRPFSTLDHSRNQNEHAGAGLGLSISLDICTSHGGILSLHKSSKLSGLMVKMKLPSS